MNVFKFAGGFLTLLAWLMSWVAYSTGKTETAIITMLVSLVIYPIACKVSCKHKNMSKEDHDTFVIRYGIATLIGFICFGATNNIIVSSLIAIILLFLMYFKSFES